VKKGKEMNLSWIFLAGFNNKSLATHIKSNYYEFKIYADYIHFWYHFVVDVAVFLGAECISDGGNGFDGEE